MQKVPEHSHFVQYVATILLTISITLILIGSLLEPRVDAIEVHLDNYPCAEETSDDD